MLPYLGSPVGYLASHESDAERYGLFFRVLSCCHCERLGTLQLVTSSRGHAAYCYPDLRLQGQNAYPVPIMQPHSACISLPARNLVALL